MYSDDEFFSFTTPNVGFAYSAYSKMLLVTVQCRPTGPRIIAVTVYRKQGVVELRD